MRVATVSDWHKATPVVEYSVWGANKNVFRSWQVGELFVLLVGFTDVVWGKVAGPPVRSDLMIWDDDLYEWRIPLRDVRKVTGRGASDLNSSIRESLSTSVHGSYGHYVRNQTAFPSDAAILIERILDETSRC